MRRLTGIVALLLLFAAAAPMLACMADRTMSPAENACCRSMRGDCGEMAKMGCCRTAIRMDVHPQLPTATPSINVRFTVVSWLAPVRLGNENAHALSIKAPNEHSPPGMIATKNTILRI